VPAAAAALFAAASTSIPRSRPVFPRRPVKAAAVVVPVVALVRVPSRRRIGPVLVRGQRRTVRVVRWGREVVVVRRPVRRRRSVPIVVPVAGRRRRGAAAVMMRRRSPVRVVVPVSVPPIAATATIPAPAAALARRGPPSFALLTPAPATPRASAPGGPACATVRGRRGRTAVLRGLTIRSGRTTATAVFVVLLLLLFLVVIGTFL
jgi:hypothetical protein